MELLSNVTTSSDCTHGRIFLSSWRSRRKSATQSTLRNSSLSQIKKRNVYFVCGSNQQQEGFPDNLKKSAKDSSAVLVIREKIGSTVFRKYTVGEKQTLSTEEINITSGPDMLSQSTVLGGSSTLFSTSSLSELFKDFFLPTDFPESVPSDYLRYMLWQFPTNVTGWACSTLVTSSLLKAVGVEAFAGTTVAATAAIKWVTKDGLGAFGRLYVGGLFGRVFDDDPKQWRLYAELIGSFGSIFELLTPVKPEWFLPLAALGQLTKAVGRGLKDPSFRVILSHFAIAGNMGDVSAKEEVWEVSAELIGIAVGVALLASPRLAESYSSLVLTWFCTRSTHLWLRYQSLGSLQLQTVNFKRAFIMAESHVNGNGIPGIPECNSQENILLSWQFLKSYIKFDCSIRDVLNDGACLTELEALLDIYSDELHILILKSNAMQKVDMHVFFKEGATNQTMLRCIWQSEWIMAHLHREVEPITIKTQISIVEKSLKKLNNQFGDFMHKMEEAGWDTSKLVLRLPKNASYLSITPSSNFKS